MRNWWRSWVRIGAVIATVVCVAGAMFREHRHALCAAGAALGFLCCVAGVALGDADLHSVWRAGGTWPHRPSLCVASAALADISFQFVWEVLGLWRWTGSGAPGLRLHTLNPKLARHPTCVQHWRAPPSGSEAMASLAKLLSLPS